MLNVNGCPRLFRGVTPDRHAGETSLAVVLASLHIPATRWIGILPKESPDRCGTCAICRTATAACLFTTSGSVVFLEFSHNQEGYYKWTKLSSLAQNAVANSLIAPRYLKVLTVLRELSVEIVVTL